MVESAWLSHRLGEVTRCHEEDVHVLHAQNLVEVVERLDLFEHDRDQRLLVRVAGKGGWIDAIGGPATSPAAVSERRVLGVLHSFLNFGGAVDMRDLDAARATIERTRDGRRIIAIDAHDRAVASQIGGTDHVLDFLPAGRTVLAVEEHAVEVQVPEQLDQAGGRTNWRDNGGGRAGRELALERVDLHTRIRLLAGATLESVLKGGRPVVSEGKGDRSSPKGRETGRARRGRRSGWTWRSRRASIWHRTVPALQLPADVEAVLRSFFTCEFTTLNQAGEPLTWPVEPFFDAAAGEIVATASIAFPVKALNARRNPHVALLYSDPTGSGLDDPPAVLIQGDARVEEWREWTPRTAEYFRLSVIRQPDSRKFIANPLARRLFAFYFQRLNITVQPRRVLVWPRRDFSVAPTEIGLAARVE